MAAQPVPSLCFICSALMRPGMAGTGALIGASTTNATGVATQNFAFTLPGNYTVVSAVSQADGTQYGLSNASISQVLVLDQTTLTMTQVRFLSSLLLLNDGRVLQGTAQGRPAGCAGAHPCFAQTFIASNHIPQTARECCAALLARSCSREVEVRDA